MASVWQTRWSEYVKRLLSLRESTSLEALPDLMPVFPVSNPASAEHHAARGEILLGAGGQITGLAGEFPTVYIGLPSTAENMILVVDSIVIASSAAQQVSWLPTSGAVPGTLSAAPTDDERIPNARTRSVISITSETVVFVGDRARTTLLPVSTPIVIPTRIVLGPGKRLSVQGHTAASRIHVVFQGYERQAMPDEFRV